jgi:chromate reductase
MPERVRILTISGSLRAVSSNGAVLDAAAALVPGNVEVIRFEGLADIPAFNPDLDVEGTIPPSAVVAWRAAVAAADALVICSPEYAHGVPGALKNALDWLVSGPDVPGKPIAIINATTRAHIAHAALVETLRTMSAEVVDEASIALPLGPSQRDRSSILADAALRTLLIDALGALVAAVERRRAVHAPGQPDAL